MATTYKESGVDINAGHKAVSLIRKKLEDTFGDTDGTVLTDIGEFGSLVELPDGNIIGAATDGVGTKLSLSILLDRHDTVGIDLVAMCVNDLAVMGITPLLFLDYIAVGKQVPEKTNRIVSGIIAGCKTARVALVGGEMAEMSGMYRNEDYDLAGFAVGYTGSKEDLITGQRIKPGMKVYGLPSSGVHSNGFSLIRNVFGIEHHKRSTATKALNEFYNELNMTLGDELLKPTRIYVDLIKKLRNQYSIAGLVHVTGGGLVDNPPRVLPDGCAIEIKSHTWKVPPIFDLISQRGSIQQEEMYRTFNMGLGLLIISSDDIAEAICIGKVVENSKKMVHFV